MSTTFGKLRSMIFGFGTWECESQPTSRSQVPLHRLKDATVTFVYNQLTRAHHSAIKASTRARNPPSSLRSELAFQTNYEWFFIFSIFARVFFMVDSHN